MRCEACDKEEAWSFSCDGKNHWTLTGMCTADTEYYYIPFNDYAKKPNGWLGHMEQKRWFDEKDFLAAVERWLTDVRKQQSR